MEAVRSTIEWSEPDIRDWNRPARHLHLSWSDRQRVAMCGCFGALRPAPFLAWERHAHLQPQLELWNSHLAVGWGAIQQRENRRRFHASQELSAGFWIGFLNIGGKLPCAVVLVPSSNTDLVLHLHHALADPNPPEGTRAITRLEPKTVLWVNGTAGLRLWFEFSLVDMHLRNRGACVLAPFTPDLI